MCSFLFVCGVVVVVVLGLCWVISVEMEEANLFWVWPSEGGGGGEEGGEEEEGG